MAYGGRGRCIGRLMSVLYRVTHRSDRWCFGDGVITDGPLGTQIGTFTWRDGTDIPEFAMTDDAYIGAVWDNKLKLAYEELNARDKRQGWLCNYSAKDYHFERTVRSELNGHLVTTFLKLVPSRLDVIEPAKNLVWRIETSPQHSFHLDMRLQFFESYPLDMKIMDGDTEIGTVADMMRYKWREDIDGPRRLEEAA